MSKKVWNSSLTAEDVASLSSGQQEELFENLNDAVMYACQEFGLFSDEEDEEEED
jgi:hypothetical protein